jgi:hypothetical protein
VKLLPGSVHGFVTDKVVVMVELPLAEIRIWVGEMISVIVTVPAGIPEPVITWPTLSPVLLATVITLFPSCTWDDGILVDAPEVREKTGLLGLVPVLVSIAHQTVAA